MFQGAYWAFCTIYARLTLFPAFFFQDPIDKKKQVRYLKNKEIVYCQTILKI